MNYTRTDAIRFRIDCDILPQFSYFCNGAGVLGSFGVFTVGGLVEEGELAGEVHLDGADGAVSVFGEDDVGEVFRGVVGLEFFIVVSLAVEESDFVCVLLK